MASHSLSNWIPIPQDSELVGSEVQPSAVSQVGRRRPMGSSTLELPRLLGSTVTGGPTLTDGTTDAAKVTMYSYLYSGKDSLDEDEVEDATVDSFSAYSFEWLNQLNISFDNAGIGVTGARSSTESDKRPYTSIYRAVTTADSEAGYTANTNYASGAASYANLSAAISKIEDTRYFSQPSMVVLAHPGLRESLRGILDSSNRPIFIEASGNVMQDTLFRLPVVWTLGAKASTDFDMGTTGGNLFVFLNRRYFVYGPRVEPQSRIIPASMNASSLTYVMQHRARKGCVLTVPQAASVFEVTS